MLPGKASDGKQELESTVRPRDPGPLDWWFKETPSFLQQEDRLAGPWHQRTSDLTLSAQFYQTLHVTCGSITRSVLPYKLKSSHA